MGGFLFVQHDNDDTLGNIEGEHAASLKIMDRKGLRRGEVLRGDGFSLLLFDKVYPSSPNAVRLDNGDFAACTGTMIYKNKMGEDALAALHADFSNGKNVFQDILGQYAVFLYRGGQLTVFNDFHGVYHIYSTPNHVVLSSSFLAAARSAPQRTISDQEALEFLLYGAYFGDRTLFEEVTLLDSRHVHRLKPVPQKIARTIAVDRPARKASFRDHVDFIVHGLLEYFRTVAGVFGDNVGSALSGGYDSRLMVACMRRVGIKPKLHVNGKIAMGTDAQVSSLIAEKEGFDLDVFNINDVPLDIPNPDPEFVENQICFYDALAINGVFGHPEGRAARHRRASRVAVMMMGGGGRFTAICGRCPIGVTR